MYTVQCIYMHTVCTSSLVPHLLTTQAYYTSDIYNNNDTIYWFNWYMHVALTYQQTVRRGLAGASCHWLRL